MQSASSRIWTHFVMSIFYDYNHYTAGTSGSVLMTRMELWTGTLSWWKCHWPDLKSAGLFRRNLFLKSLQNLNIVTLTLTLWPINSGVLTSLLLPHLSSSRTNYLPSSNLLCHSKTDAQFMQDAPKAVWSIPCFCGIFSKFKTEFYSVLFFYSVRWHFWNSPAVTIRL